MADALAKAAEALREWLGRQYCNVYCTYRDPGRCTRATSECIGRCLWVNASDAARAVLEAAGYGRLRVAVDAAKAYMEHCAVIDPSGREIAHVLTSEDGNFRHAEYLVRAANAYPRLRAALEKALEACRLTVAADDAPNLHVCLPLLKKAATLAREALEMAEGRDGNA